MTPTTDFLNLVKIKCKFIESTLLVNSFQGQSIATCRMIDI